jgi:hypothetical protein
MPIKQILCFIGIVSYQKSVTEYADIINTDIIKKPDISRNLSTIKFNLSIFVCMYRHDPTIHM